jgi:hypothetical protein
MNARVHIQLVDVHQHERARNGKNDADALQAAHRALQQSAVAVQPCADESMPVNSPASGPAADWYSCPSCTGRPRGLQTT